MRKIFPVIFILASAFFPLCQLATAAKENVRFPYVAGGFYPGDAKILSEQIDQFLKKAGTPQNSGVLPRLLMVPHAGYVYSGRTAAYAYATLQGLHFDTVVLIGPYHQEAIEGASVWTHGDWRTPLGDVPIDEAMAKMIFQANPSFQHTAAVHMTEHSLEVQLPFLQKTLKSFKIVPILLNNPSIENTSRLAEAVAKAVEDKNALIVISTDMSHYYADDVARRMDGEAIQFLQKNDEANLRKALYEKKSEFCGAAAVLTGLEILKIHNAPSPVLLHYSDTSDATGDKTRVVGYGALVSYHEKKGVDYFTVAREKELLALARRTLEKYLADGRAPAFSTSDSFLKQKAAVFVTLTKDGKLRGCIGTLLPQKPMVTAIQDKAIDAALHDTRFKPVTAGELKSLQIEISVLSTPKKIKTADEIVMGRDGVIVNFEGKTGVFLPQVARETGWTREEFLSELCSEKAGIAPDAWKDPRAELYVFTAHDFHEDPVAS